MFINGILFMLGMAVCWFLLNALAAMWLEWREQNAYEYQARCDREVRESRARVPIGPLAMPTKLASELHAKALQIATLAEKA